MLAEGFEDAVDARRGEQCLKPQSPRTAAVAKVAEVAVHHEPVVHERLAGDEIEIGIATEAAERKRVAEAIRLELLQHELRLHDGVALVFDPVSAERDLKAERVAGRQEPELRAGIGALGLIERLDLTVLDYACVVSKERSRRLGRQARAGEQERAGGRDSARQSSNHDGHAAATLLLILPLS